MPNNQNPQNLPVAPTAAGKKIVLGNKAELDLSSLSDEEQRELLKDHARGVLDINKKALELGVDATSLHTTLGTLVDTTKQVADNGNSVTIQHEHKTSNTHTKIVMGNTSEAAKGSMSFGMDPRTLLLVGAAVVVVIVVALLLGGR